MSGPKVLFVRLDSMGDVVLTTPCFEVVKRRYPDACVDVVLQPAWAPLLDGDPRVDHVFTLRAPWHAGSGSWRETFAVLQKLRARRYDYVITLRRDLDDALFARLCGGRGTIGFWAWRTRPLLSAAARFQPHLHTVENQLALLSLLGCGQERMEPNVYCTTGGASLVLRRLRDAGPTLVGIAPFGSTAAKRWPADRVVQLIDALATMPGVTPVLLGGPDDREAALPVLARTARVVTDLVGKTSLPETCDVLRRCSFVVSVDSGPMHLAAAVGTPVVALFGGEDPRLWAPYGAAPHRLLRAVDAQGRPSLAAIDAPAVVAAVGELLASRVEGDDYMVSRSGAREEVAA